MADKKVSQLLKEFGLTDDQILDVAISDTLKEGVSKLKTALQKKWDIDTISAMKTVEKLKKEFE